MVAGLTPRVQITILARDKERELPMFLKCVENIDYEPRCLDVYVHTNNNSDRTTDILKEWCDKNRNKYGSMTFVEEDIPELRDKPGRKSEDDWYADGGIRLVKLAEIRQKSLEYAYKQNCKYYFVCDVDNFFPPETIRYCVDQNKPIISPMMVQLNGAVPRSFYHICAPNGYWQNNPLETLIWNKSLTGVFKVDLVHMCYMIKTDNLLRGLSYHTDGVQMEFVTFARSARFSGVNQYVTNEIQTLIDPSDDYEKNVNTCRNLRYVIPYTLNV